MPIASAFDFDCAVIGGGPAGLVSSLYLGRFRRSTVQFAYGTPRAHWIPRANNLIGHSTGISGPALLSRLQEQARDAGVASIESEARLRPLRRGFQVDYGRASSVRVKKVILATGIDDIQPAIPNLHLLRHQGFLRYCPICDAYEYRNQAIAVLARDDHGLKEALFLASYSNQVSVLLMNQQPPSVHLAEKCRRAKIQMTSGRLTGIERVSGSKAVEIFARGLDPIAARVCYVALGLVTKDRAWRHIKRLKRAESGRLIVDHHQRTSVAGLFAVGDCVDGLAQLSVAAGQAAIAATALHNELREGSS